MLDAAADSRFVTHKDLAAHTDREQLLRHDKIKEITATVNNIQIRLDDRIDDVHAEFDKRVNDVVRAMTDPQQPHALHHQELREWRAELRGSAKTVRAALGTSVIAVVGTLLALIGTIINLMRG